MWVLSDTAIADPDIMVEWGARTFGLRQSERYEVRIVAMFDLLASSPGLGRQRRSTSGPVRVKPCGAHHIVYREEGDDVAILRVLHHLQDLDDSLMPDF